MKPVSGTQRELGGAAADSLLKCVWMLAGVVAYKLCDRRYDCEHCPFDQAIRESAPPQVQQQKADSEVLSATERLVTRAEAHGAEGPLVHGYRLGAALFYHPAHIWARVEEEGRVRAGLDDFGQKLVGRIYSIRLPQPGMRVNSGRACWEIAYRAGRTQLGAPVTGIVRHVNEKLGILPSLINQDPYGLGWAMVIEPVGLMESLKSLYYGKSAELWYQHQVESLREELLSVMRSTRPDVQVTLQDGGLQIEDLARVLSASQHHEIVGRFLSVPLGCQSDFLGGSQGD